jgi:predicted pyridoxine 5'-phosphate oxidase superfamily flavin-nucleotide-binding protein
MSTNGSTPRVRGFHAGERRLQERAGVAAQMAPVADRVIRDFMPEQHRAFFAQLPFAILGGIDGHGRPWASALAGPPGFLSSPDPNTLRIAALPAAQDPLGAAVQAGAAIALLGIEPHTRRRNRVNGLVTAVDAAGFTLQVLESFGNCPKYIQARKAQFDETRRVPEHPALSAKLDERGRRMVAAADTFFIATAHPDAGRDRAIAYGADVSHRGGKPGFVRLSPGALDGPDVLTVPDFTGNNFFNTLGNIALNPRVGLLFIDFAGGNMLQIAGSAAIVFEGPELASYAGALRLLQVSVASVRQSGGALPLRWSAEAELSPHLHATGEWPAAAN